MWGPDMGAAIDVAKKTKREAQRKENEARNLLTKCDLNSGKEAA
jgi:hypothetical protein